MDDDRIWIWRWARGDARVFCSAECATAWARTQTGEPVPLPTTAGWLRACTACYICGMGILAGHDAENCLICMDGVEDDDTWHELDSFEYQALAVWAARELLRLTDQFMLEDWQWEVALDAAWEAQGEDPRRIITLAMRGLGYDY